mgnify:CR=1 FL=1
MAGSGMKQIKNRIRSIESTRQITKAMELVATSKLRHARERVERARPYCEVLGEAIGALRAAAHGETCDYLDARPIEKICIVVIGGDRGLAGGYNANLFRLVEEQRGDIPLCVLPVGKKTLEYFEHRNWERVSDAFGKTADVGVGDCVQLARLLCEGYHEGRFDRVVLAYTQFTSMLSQTPRLDTLLPLQFDPAETDRYADALADAEPEALLHAIVPQYVTGLLYGALCEASASEHGARRTAMNAANKNAGELIDSLTLRYHRARQAAVTQELTEIVSGAQAL